MPGCFSQGFLPIPKETPIKEILTQLKTTEIHLPQGMHFPFLLTIKKTGY